MRLIDADGYARDMKVRQEAALKWCNDAKTRCDYVDYALVETAFSIFCEAKMTLDKQPTVDAVPVVRCRDCIQFVKYRTAGGGLCGITGDYIPEDFYCADGKRKGGDE